MILAATPEPIVDVDVPCLVHELGSMADASGSGYVARVIGVLREDGLWDGYIEFTGSAGRVLVSPRETRQPNLADLVYWSTGLDAQYVEGALSRAVDANFDAVKGRQRRTSPMNVAKVFTPRRSTAQRRPRRVARAGGASAGRVAR